MLIPATDGAPMLAIPFPAFDPVVVEIGPFAIRWYALAYLFGLVLGWRYARALSRKPPALIPALAIDDFLVWATLGVILGGRLGYVLIVQPHYFLDHPLAALEIWKGGMSFHGGLLGVVIAGWLYTSFRALPKAAFADIIFCAAPIGLFLGRIANFVNGELAGRVTDVSWAVLFPDPPWGPLPRHPSQLYEAATEGLALFMLLFFLHRHEVVRRRPGLLSGVFLVGYAVARGGCEQFREIDPLIGPLGPGLTMGQLLSLPMLIAGVFLITRALRRSPVS